MRLIENHFYGKTDHAVNGGDIQWFAAAPRPWPSDRGICQGHDPLLGPAPPVIVTDLPDSAAAPSETAGTGGHVTVTRAVGGSLYL